MRDELHSRLRDALAFRSLDYPRGKMGTTRGLTSLWNETNSWMKVTAVSYKETLTSFYESTAFKIGYKNSHLPTQPGRPSFPLPHQNNTHQPVTEALITDCRVAPATDEKPIEGFLLPAKCQSAQPLPRQHQWPLPVRVPQISVGTVHYGPVKGELTGFNS